MAEAYFWSILFMMSMPFLILFSLSTYFYLLVRKARLEAAASHQAVETGSAANDSAISTETSDQEMIEV